MRYIVPKPYKNILDNIHIACKEAYINFVCVAAEQIIEPSVIQDYFKAEIYNYNAFKTPKEIEFNMLLKLLNTPKYKGKFKAFKQALELNIQEGFVYSCVKYALDQDKLLKVFGDKEISFLSKIIADDIKPKILFYQQCKNKFDIVKNQNFSLKLKNDPILF